MKISASHLCLLQRHHILREQKHRTYGPKKQFLNFLNPEKVIVFVMVIVKVRMGFLSPKGGVFAFGQVMALQGLMGWLWDWLGACS